MADFGLLGRRLGHSYSPRIHALLADYNYLLYEKEPEELESFLISGDFNGLNVTIPYKKSVIAYCGEISDMARSIGSVNTLVRRPDGSLYGDNTDAFGFESLVKKSGIDVCGAKALVLGSGGASVTVCAVLKKLGAGEITVISRSGENNYGNIEKHSDAEIIVNATPVGMYPANGESPVDLHLFPSCRGVLDVIYNPGRTALLMQAEELGIANANGLHMLVAQAKRSCEIFTEQSIANDKIDRIEDLLRSEMQNIILTGMPGCGKSTVAEKLAEKLGRKVVDTDAEIETLAGMSIPEIFEKSGEEQFRKLEAEVIAASGKLSGMIISTGGGCVTRKENYKHLHQNGVIVWLRRDIEKLAREGRPLSENADLRAMYEKRRGCYESFADITAENNGDIDDTVMRILNSVSNREA